MAKIKKKSNKPRKKAKRKYSGFIDSAVVVCSKCGGFVGVSKHDQKDKICADCKEGKLKNTDIWFYD